MDIPMTWLKEYVDVDCNLKEFVHRMTMTGTKVESYKLLGSDLDKIVVGRILSIEKHPNADKLTITKVDIGEQEPIQIVTGATNIYEGAYIPVVLGGGLVSGGKKIKSGKLRGHLSQGMLCSIEELGYDTTVYPEAPKDGIYIFSEPQTLGRDVAEILEITDEVVEYEITSNRPDCYSVLGIAREAAATLNKPLKFIEPCVKEQADGNAFDMIYVEIKNPILCPRYIARVVKNVKIQPSPQWMRHRLAAAGLRPINNIVDITNYVMLELGQPMHAFDIDAIYNRKIIVRNAKDAEKFVTLDGCEHILDSSMLVIADEEKAVAIAGVMGGENSKVSEGASAILFESANFNGTNIRLTAKKLGMRTDASSKYEKGLDPNLAFIAVNRAVQLVEHLGAGEVVPAMVDCYPNVRNEHTVNFEPYKINTLLGTDLSDEDMLELLEKVEIKSVKVDSAYCATIPTFRSDIETQADIAEEIARFFGYDNIPETLAQGTPTVGKKTYSQVIEEKIYDTMIACGLSEALNYSFESPKVFDKLNIPNDNTLRNAIKISNPLGEDFSIMRTTTLNGMLQSLSINYNRRNSSANLFEISKVYIPKQMPITELPYENKKLTIGMYGDCDFYDLKGILEELFEKLGIEVLFLKEERLPYMHTKRCAKILINDVPLGYFGEIHPQVLINYEIGTKAYVAEIDVEQLIINSNIIKKYKAPSKYPAVTRDIAMLVCDDIMVQEIEDIIKNSSNLIKSIKLFDVYKGAQIPDNLKSVAYSITFRSYEKTLTDEEVSTIMKKIVSTLENKFGITLR